MTRLWRRLRRKRVPQSELNNADIMAAKSSLEHSVDSWEAVAHIFTALVAVGLIIEYRGPFVNFWNTHDWRYIRDSIGGILVTIGVAGELLTGFRATAKDGELREANSILALRATEALAASSERIVELNLEIAKAQEAAAKAEARAAEANLELERFRAPRHLTDEQVRDMADRLRPFAGQEFDVTPYWDNSESLDFANELADLLVHDADWIYVKPAQTGHMLGGKIGVFVWSHPDADTRTKMAVAALVSALIDNGFAAAPRAQNPGGTGTNVKNNKIGINVGSKY